MLKKTASIVLVLIISVGLIFVTWNNRFNVLDYFALRNYTPPTEIAQIASETKMNEEGKHLFYVKKPSLSDKTVFNQHCKSKEQTIVLGCYNGMNIYIYDVKDSRLNGVEQVTAAHEMLHVAYERLDSSEKKRIDSLTAEAFKRLNDPRINELTGSYEKQSPGSVPNELHSILGTEVKDVGGDLEAYYSKYFSDRSEVVGYAVAYESIFENIRNQVKNYDADIALRKNEIAALESELESKNSYLDQLRQRMDSLIASNQTKSYNALVPEYNQKVQEYNQGVENLKQLIQEHNQLVDARNNLAIEQTDLAQSLDSRLNTKE